MTALEMQRLFETKLYSISPVFNDTEKIDTDTITEIAKKQPYYAVFRDSSFLNDSALVNVEQVFKTYSPSTIRRVL